MSDDWGWFFASANARSNMLREEVSSLGMELSSANAASSRLSSQLATLSGSIETRLNALSAAFDAYVELGDIREQLASHPDTSSIRREVMGAIEALAAGRPAVPIDPRDLGYWLPYAMNAVSAIVAGHGDPAAEKSARELSPEAEVFIVAGCGALGHGTEVAGRVPALLVSDGTLSPMQVALWTAAYTGVFGPVLDQVGVQWQNSLATRPNEAEWARWVSDQSHSGASGGLTWLREQTATEPADSAPPPDATAARQGLQAVVTPLVTQGMGAEVALLERARELRARIEDPAGVPQRSPRTVATDTDQVIAPTVMAEVRRAFVATAPGSPEHLMLAAWMKPGLAAAAAGLRAQATAVSDTSGQVSIGGRSVTVSASGPDSNQLVVATDNIAAMNAVPVRPMYLGAGAGAFLLVIAVVFGVSGNGVAAFLTLVLAGVAAAWAFSQLRARNAGQAAAESQVRELQADIDRQRTRSQEAESRLRAVRQDSIAVADEVTRQLEALPSVATQTPAGGGGV